MVKCIYFYNKIELYTTDLPSLLVLYITHHYTQQNGIYMPTAKFHVHKTLQKYCPTCNNTPTADNTFAALTFHDVFFSLTNDRVAAIIKSSRHVLFDLADSSPRTYAQPPHYRHQSPRPHVSHSL